MLRRHAGALALGAEFVERGQYQLEIRDEGADVFREADVEVLLAVVQRERPADDLELPCDIDPARHLDGGEQHHDDEPADEESEKDAVEHARALQAPS
jgi:hypothetical protein